MRFCLSSLRARAIAFAAPALFALTPAPALAGAQVEEQLARSVVAGLQHAIADSPVPVDVAKPWLRSWIDEMSRPALSAAHSPVGPQLVRGDRQGAAGQ